MSNKIMLLISKVSLLKIPPEAWDAIIPHGPKVSQALVEYMAAGVIRDIARLVKDKTAQAKLMSIGKGMAGHSSSGLVQGWEDGDDICPPWRWPIPPGPWHSWEEKANPTPDPWKIGSVKQIVLADLVISLAGVTANAEFGRQLKDVACALVKRVSHNLVADFEQSIVGQREGNENRS